MWAAGVPLVETTRGGCVESVHYGAIAVVDAQRGVKWSVGHASLMTFPRSSLKPLQLLALVAGGGIERFGLQPDELAVMAGSHGGEPMHVDRVLRILQKIDAPPSALACGAQTPLDSAAAAELTRAGSAPTVLHNNCSGKHAGMLALARLLGAQRAGVRAAAAQDGAGLRHARRSIRRAGALAGWAGGDRECHAAASGAGRGEPRASRYGADADETGSGRQKWRRGVLLRWARGRQRTGAQDPGRRSRCA